MFRPCPPALNHGTALSPDSLAFGIGAGSGIEGHDEVDEGRSGKTVGRQEVLDTESGQIEGPHRNQQETNANT